MSERPPGFEIPIHKSLTDRILWAGVPREFMILNCTIGAIIMQTPSIWYVLLINFALHFVARNLTKEDPEFFNAMRRHIKEPDYFDV